MRHLQGKQQPAAAAAAAAAASAAAVGFVCDWWGLLFLGLQRRRQKPATPRRQPGSRCTPLGFRV